MDLPEEARILHEPARLRIMALLYERGDVSAAAARRTLGLTAGNLDSHARRLADAGHVKARKVLTREGFEARYAITPQGIAAMEAYLGFLESIVAGVKAQANDRRPSGSGRPHSDA